MASAPGLAWAHQLDAARGAARRSAAQRGVNPAEAYLREDMAAFIMGYHMPKQYPVKQNDLSVKPAVFTGIAFLVLTMNQEYGFEVVLTGLACLLAAYQLPF